MTTTEKIITAFVGLTFIMFGCMVLIEPVFGTCDAADYVTLWLPSGLMLGLAGMVLFLIAMEE